MHCRAKHMNYLYPPHQLTHHQIKQTDKISEVIVEPLSDTRPPTYR